MKSHGSKKDRQCNVKNKLVKKKDSDIVSMPTLVYNLAFQLILRCRHTCCKHILFINACVPKQNSNVNTI